MTDANPITGEIDVDDAMGRQVRPFADWMHEQRGGLTHAELSEAFQELIRAVSEEGKAGQLTFTVKVKPASKGQTGGPLLVTDDIKVKAPQPERAESIFFVDRDNNLRRDNPAQPRLPLKEVPPPTPAEGATELREAK